MQDETNAEKRTLGLHYLQSTCVNHVTSDPHSQCPAVSWDSLNNRMVQQFAKSWIEAVLIEAELVCAACPFRPLG